MPIAELVPYIDWTFFFTAWELNGRYPEILEHPRYGQAARELYDAAQALLAKLVAERQLRARAVYGIWPANADGNDLVLFEGEARSKELVRFPMLRQQRDQGGEPQRSLADFVAPLGSGLPDHVGAFAVTAGIGADQIVARFKKEHDDYHAIMTQALADRLAEAFAEMLHERVRREWGHGESTKLTSAQLAREEYRGIRPAFGYPACPDHTEKAKLFQLLVARDIGVELTESFAMTPPASVSGIYLAHPEARYFGVGKIDRAQVEDYARRKAMTVAEVERWLGPQLGYDPAGR
jgi:5-methyltetrahydrofolate--homocysteine methyltransferase